MNPPKPAPRFGLLQILEPKTRYYRPERQIIRQRSGFELHHASHLPFRASILARNAFRFQL